MVYPFGYGNGYADFTWTLVEEKTTANAQPLDKNTNNKIQVTVNVKNESTKYSGKDVIQLYYSAPYINNGIEKAHVVLGGIVKTDLLAPGEAKDYTVSLDIKDMASYDYSDANGNGFRGYELEQGTYTIYVGRNAHDCWAGTDAISLEYSLFDDIAYPIDIYGEGGSDNRFDSMSEYMNGKTMSRSGFNATFPQTPTRAEREISEEVREGLTFKYDDTNGGYVKSFSGSARQQGKSGNAPQLYEMLGVDYDDAKWDELLDYLTVDEMVTLVGQGNFHTVSIDSIGKPRTIDPDGPAG